MLAILFICWIVGLILIYQSHESTLHGHIEKIVQHRTISIQQQVDIARVLVEQLRKQMKNNIYLVEMGYEYPAISHLKDHPELGIYASDELSPYFQNLAISGASLTGMGSIDALDEKIKQEISAALMLSLTTKALSKVNTDFEWLYYTSKNGFLSLAPKAPVKEVHFVPELYNKPFWQIAIPENNPDRITMISDLYEDAGNKGDMFSLSAPVYVNDEFRGVASIDLGVEQLRKSLLINDIPGDSFLVDEKGQIVASPHKFNIGDKINDFSIIEYHQGYFFKNQDGIEYYMLPVVDEELYLLHQITTKQKLASMFSLYMLGSLLILTILIITIFLLVTLRNALKENTLLATYDSLTNLYNRRAMEAQAQKLFEQAPKDSEELCIMMLDIDQFKLINDTYGHSMGDKVICQIAKILKENSRESSDFISRIGGEEFVIFMPNIKLNKAQQAAERIRQAVEACHISHQNKSDFIANVTISIGLIKYNLNETYDAALNRADLYLYKAKNNGRNRVETAF